MRLAPIGWILLVTFLGWVTLAISLAYADWKLRLEDRYRLQTRDWQEKVEAMRRMQDEDGAA
jgi:hypothetical protein